MRFERYPLWCVGCVAVLCHLVLLGVAHSRWGSIDALAFSSVDAREYHALACSLLDEAAFARDGRAEAWRTPGYPAILAALAVVVGRSPAALIIAQQVFAILNVILVAHLVARASNVRRGWLAAGLLLIEPYHHYYSLWLLSTTVFTTAVLLMWWWWTRVVEHQRWIDVVGLGLFCGAVILLRPLAVLMPVALVGALLWSLRRRVGRSAWPRAGVLIATSIVGPMLWMTRNAAVHDHFALSSQSGVVLAYFKAAEVQLWREGRSVARYLQTSLHPTQSDAPHDVWVSIDQRLQAALTPRNDPEMESANLKLDVSGLHWKDLAAGRVNVWPFEISKQLRSIGSSMMLEAPLSTVTCGIWRALVLLTTPLNREFVNYYGVPPSGPQHALLGLAYAFVAAFAAWRVASGPLTPTVCFAACAVLALLAVSTPQLDPRLRVPMMPLLIALAVLQRNGRPPVGNKDATHSLPAPAGNTP